MGSWRMGAAAALVLGVFSLAGRESGALTREEAADVAILRAENEVLLASLRDARRQLAAAPDPDAWIALEKRLREMDDGAWDAAVELGIVERFQQAQSGLTEDGIRRAAAAVVREARAAGLDPLLVAAVIEVESTFRNYAVSSKGAIGLMQVMPGTGTWLGERWEEPIHHRAQLFDPERNIRFGVRYLAELQDRFGRTDLALLAYNAGPARARTILQGPSDRLERWLAGYAANVLAAERRMRRQLALTSTHGRNDGPERTAVQ